MTLPLRTIARTGISVTPVAMGCWPIAGITSIGVTEAQSLRTLEAAFDSGINLFDTAYCYGYDGESESLIARALGARRDRIVIATKCGIHWEQGRQAKDARPETIRRECETSLRRLQTDTIDLYYLHAPDPAVPVERSAEEFARLLAEQKIRSVGVSNFSLEQLERFATVLLPHAFQPHFNMLQREIERSQLPWCVRNGVSTMIYWPLMKGLLAGKLGRDHRFDPRDGRQKYPMFQGEEWRKNHDFLDALRPLARETGRTLAQVVINWTVQRPGITVALCGAKRPEQIRDNAAAMQWSLTPDQLAQIDRAIAARGQIVSKAAV